ncbi:MAG: DUF4179 domain-containing protein [Clostridiaceae bacterium]|nr:DUF4179 domain-containing protein [Clostridiaceae bacterium]
MKNSKNLYEFLNQMDFQLNNYEKEELSDIEKKSLKNNFKNNLKSKRRKKYNFKQLGSMLAVLVLTIGVFSQTSFGKEVYAMTQSKVSEISYSIGKALGIEKNIEIYGNVVDKVVEINGVEIKLTDVIIDKDELIFSTILNTNKPVDGVDFSSNIFINGKRLRNYSGSGTSGAIDGSEDIYYSINSVHIKEIDTKENLDIKIELTNLSYYVDNIKEEVKGKWEFEFTANGNELMADTYVLPIDYSFDIDDTSYILEEFRYNPINQKIFGKRSKISTDTYRIDLRGHDNLGNEVTFFLSRISDEDLIFKYENIHGNLSDEITSISLTPYAAKLPKKSGRMSNDYKQAGEEFTIFLNN